MFDLYRALLDLDEDVERFSQGIKAVGAVSAAISQAHCYGSVVALAAAWRANSRVPESRTNVKIV